MFISTKDSDVIGLTPDQAGSNLPAGYAPWEPAAEGGAVLIGGDTDPVTEAVRRHGFFLAVGGYEDDRTVTQAIH